MCYREKRGKKIFTRANKVLQDIISMMGKEVNGEIADCRESLYSSRSLFSSLSISRMQTLLTQKSKEV